MSIFKQLSLAAVGAIVVTTMFAAKTVRAINFTTTPYDSNTCPTPEGCVSNVSGAVSINFNNNAGATKFTDPSGFATYTLNLGSEVRAAGAVGEPLGDTTAYLAVNAGSVVTPAGSVTIDFNAPVNYFGLYWASTDSTNKIDFYNQGALVGSFTGLQTDPGGTNRDQYINFFSDGTSDYFNQVKLSNDNATIGTAFESDNHAYRKVPYNFSPGVGLLALGILSATAQLKSKLQKGKTSKKVSKQHFKTTI